MLQTSSFVIFVLSIGYRIKIAYKAFVTAMTVISAISDRVSFRISITVRYDAFLLL